MGVPMVGWRTEVRRYEFRSFVKYARPTLRDGRYKIGGKFKIKSDRAGGTPALQSQSLLLHQTFRKV
jgi:hypothetical protein